MTMLDSEGQIKPLVERLRQIAQEWREIIEPWQLNPHLYDGREIIEPWQLDPHLYDEAADEIERLRAVIIRYLDFAQDVAVSPVAPELKPIRDAMREAVGYERRTHEQQKSRK